jgi:hypothetical protein
MRSQSPVPAEKVAYDLLKSNERVAELQSISRDASVSQIASRFKGKSLAESRQDFQKKQRKINNEDRLLKLAMFYFQLNKQKSDNKTITAKDDCKKVVENTDCERVKDSEQSPVPVKELKAFWNVNKSSPHSVSSNNSPKSIPVSGLTKRQITEVLQSSGIAENLVEAEDWIHWENAINSVFEDHVNGKLLISPTPSSDPFDSNSTHQEILSPRPISPIPFPDLIDPQHSHLLDGGRNNEDVASSSLADVVGSEVPIHQLVVGDTAAHSHTPLISGKPVASEEEIVALTSVVDSSPDNSQVLPSSAVETANAVIAKEANFFTYSLYLMLLMILLLACWCMFSSGRSQVNFFG